MGNQVCRNSLSFLKSTRRLRWHSALCESLKNACNSPHFVLTLYRCQKAQPVHLHMVCLRSVLSINYRYLLFPRVMVVRTRSPQDPKGWMSCLYLESRVHRHRLPHICTPVYSRLLCLNTLVVLCIVHSCNPNRGHLTYLSCTHTPWSCVPPGCWTRVPQCLPEHQVEAVHPQNVA